MNNGVPRIKRHLSLVAALLARFTLPAAQAKCIDLGAAACKGVPAPGSAWGPCVEHLRGKLPHPTFQPHRSSSTPRAVSRSMKIVILRAQFWISPVSKSVLDTQ